MERVQMRRRQHQPLLRLLPLAAPNARVPSPRRRALRAVRGSGLRLRRNHAVRLLPVQPLKHGGRARADVSGLVCAHVRKRTAAPTRPCCCRAAPFSPSHSWPRALRYMFNALGSSPLVSGFFWDDTWDEQCGLWDQAPHTCEDMGLTSGDLKHLTASYRANMDKLVNATLAAGKFAWHLLWTGGSDRSLGGGSLQPLVRPATCAADLRRLCAAESPPQTRAMAYGFNTTDPAVLPALKADVYAAHSPSTSQQEVPQFHTPAIPDVCVHAARVAAGPTSCSSVGRTRGWGMAGWGVAARMPSHRCFTRTWASRVVSAERRRPTAASSVASGPMQPCRWIATRGRPRSTCGSARRSLMSRLDELALAGLIGDSRLCLCHPLSQARVRTTPAKCIDCAAHGT